MNAQQLHGRLREKFGESIQEYVEVPGDPYLRIAPEKVREICHFLREDPGLQFDLLHCVSGVDLKDKLAAVYQLYSTKKDHSKLVLRAEVAREQPAVASVAGVWKGANWLERETYDMTGIVFEGHPDLRRILCPDDWEGYPLRKDYVVPEFYEDVRVPAPE